MAKIFNGKAENLLVVYSYIRKQTLTLSRMAYSECSWIKEGVQKTSYPSSRNPLFISRNYETWHSYTLTEEDPKNI